MHNLDVVFSRLYLQRIHSDVKKHQKSINLWKGAWVYTYGRDHWEFHGPDDFYWYGRASNAYDARARGWADWLKKEKVNGYI